MESSPGKVEGGGEHRRWAAPPQYPKEDVRQRRKRNIIWASPEELSKSVLMLVVLLAELAQADCRVAGLRGGGSGAGTVKYCKTCSLPDEYCLFLKRCPAKKAADAAVCGDLRRVAGNGGGGESGDLASKIADGLTLGGAEEDDDGVVDGAAASPAGTAKGKKGGGQVKKKTGIVIKVDKRRARKFVTTVSGLDGFVNAVELKAAVKQLQGILAAGVSSVKAGAGQPDYISIQVANANTNNTAAAHRCSPFASPCPSIALR
jgi:translation initiation factor 1 (eIF-1/SUI1)